MRKKMEGVCYSIDREEIDKEIKNIRVAKERVVPCLHKEHEILSTIEMGGEDGVEVMEVCKDVLLIL